MNTIIENAVAYTKQFIKIPSESSIPCATDKLSPESGMVEILAKICTEHKISCHIQEAMPGRFNFVANIPRPNVPKLLIAAHLDTVSATGMDEPFSAQELDGKIFGRGACDDKGPLATALSTICGLYSQKADFQYDITLLGTVDEECSMAGAAHFARERHKFDLCIALEPTGLQLINAHKGVYRCQIASHGKAAHSSSPELGENAILNMHTIISDLQKFADNLKKDPDPDLGEATLAITQIKGGTVINIIPDKCTISLDLRMLPRHDPKKISVELKSLVGKRGSVRKVFAAKAVHSDLKDRQIINFTDSLRAEGFSTVPTTAAYATDCSRLKENGPCIVWGPGSINQAHKLDEYIETKQIEGGCKILANFLTRKVAKPL
jgi:acetylornithine deacetylase/succinyl-diaminopimelate desuccinylase-like protein